LPNLPLHLWYTLEDIGNVLGKFIKEDMDRTHSGLCTYACICVEIDMSKGLPDRINLKFGNYQYSQALDYENTAFRCRFCTNLGHLQTSCPLNKKPQSSKKGGAASSSGWGFPNLDLVDATFCKEKPSNSNTEDKTTEKMEKEKTDTEKENQGILVVGRTKRGHISDKSDSDQDSLPDNPTTSSNPSDLTLVVLSDNGKWHEVIKRKSKKGRMGKY
ncbi:hypothetical protein KI387_032759, partial [Taxus chinensis]